MSCSVVLQVFAVVSLLILSVSSHSWVHCTDYDGTITGQDFDETLCNGYIRQWQTQWAALSFATDRGVNYQSGGPNWCQSSFNADISSIYDDNYPYATWKYDETVTIVWPAKNHANYECFNFIPDTSMKLYYNPNVNPNSEPGGTDVTDEWSLLIDWHDGCTPGTDGCGFQNCPDFCANTDGAPCFGEYTVSREHFPEPGFYTLLWYWIFNPGTPYTTCFEVFIDGTPAPTAPTTPSAPSSTPSPTPANNDDDGGNNNDDDNNNNNNDDDNGNNDGNTGNTDTGNGDDSSDDDDVIIYDYLVLIPICYTGATYDENTLLDGAHNVNYESSTEVDWMVLTVEDDGGEDWNATIQTHTNSASDVTLTSYSYATDSSQLCEAIEDEFGTGTCEICDPGAMRTYSFIVTGDDDDDGNDTLNKNSDEEGENWWIWLVVALIGIILILLTGISVYVCMKRKENGGGSSSIQSNKNMNEFGLTNVMTTNTQAIRAVSDDHDDDQHVTGMPQYNQYNSNSPPTGHGRPNGAPPRPPPPPRR